MNAESVPIDKIVIPSAVKRQPAKVGDEMLRRSIEKDGIQQPLILVRDGARYLLAKGLRRLREARGLGLARVPAVIDASPAGVRPERHAAHLRFVLVHHRQDLLPTQRGELVWTLRARFGMSNAQVAEYLGVAADTVTNWLSIRHYIEPVRKAMDADHLSMNMARVFDGMTEPGQAAIWKQCGEAMMTDRSVTAAEWHQKIRAAYAPLNYPQFYKQPELVAVRLARKSSGKRKSRPRATVSKAEKKSLAGRLDMKETELKSNKEELARYIAEIEASIKPLAAILRHPELAALVPEEMREELDRFAEVYI